MGQMQLDVKDRLILANQFKILEKLHPEEAESYAKFRRIVEGGYELCYDWLVEQLSEPVAEEQCREVMAILDMYRRLRFSYDELSAADKQKIDASEFDFPGFDGNNESELLSLHEFFASQGKWQESPAINSHSPSIEIYRRMLNGYQPFKDIERLNAEQISQVLAERIHPSRRG